MNTSQLTPEQIAEWRALAKKAKFGHFDLMQFTEKFTPNFAESLLDALESRDKRIAELEANQQKIESMSAYSDERLKEIEEHRDNSLLGHIPADLARELRQTRSRLGNYYDLLRRTDVAERKVSNLTVALRANGISLQKGDE